jgi:hypothetical protein
VDTEFHALLLERRGVAAQEIGLDLDPAEVAMLNSIPGSLLEGIIARTTVDPMSRAAFLGKAAAGMLVALGAGAGCAGCIPVTGIAPDRVPVTDGIRPDRPEPADEPTKGTRPDRPGASAEPPPVTNGIRPDRP